MGSLNNPFDSKQKDLQIVIKDFLIVSNANDAYRILKQHPELLSEEVESKLNALLKVTQNDKIINAVQNRLKILAHCREVGISQAFEEISRKKDLQKILEEALSLSKSQDIPRKILRLQQALSLVSRQSNPKLWACLQMLLGNSLLDGLQRYKGEKIEQAINHYNQSLEVFTRQDFSVEWATVLHKLGVAYSERVKGDRATNLEQSIEYYNQSLEVRTYHDFPADWALTKNNLAIAYNNRIMGDKVYNIEQAIEYYNQALEVYTYQDFPVDWAHTKNNLGTVYRNRIKGNKSKNIEQAIEHFNQALKVFTPHDFPVEWATTQNNLGNAYWSRIMGDKAENIEQAIECYNQAFRVRTPQSFPTGWADTQNNLAIVYCNRIVGEKIENIVRAIEHYNNALEVYTLHDFPISWAMIQNNLANAYKDSIRGDRTKYIEQAIIHFHSALQIYKLGSMPDDFRRVCRLLGDLYFDMDQWKDSLESYLKAIKAGDLLYHSGLSAESKILEAGENANIYRNASLAACRLGLALEALLILERGKTRILSEKLQLKTRPPKDIPIDEWMKYKQAAEKYRISIKSSDREDYTQREKEIQKLVKELDAASKVIQRYDPNFQKELDIPDILSIPDSETALLTFCITNKGSIGFIVSESRGIQSVDIPYFKKEILDSPNFQLGRQRPITFGWIDNYWSYLDGLGTIQNEDPLQAWKDTFNEVLSLIGTRLLYPLLAELPPQIKRLVLLPSGGLFLFPLHAVPLPDSQLLCQKYCISYAPSIQLLKEMKNKAGTVKGKGLYAVINPQEDTRLAFSRCEGQAISKLFQSSQVNVGETGTKLTVLDRIPGREYIHFSCHGSYNWVDSLLSGLYLVGGQTLSLADLQSDIVDMSSARLVTLSSCETGIIDVLRSSADEFVGLPAGFMLAGVPCVVSSLWSVPDISTAILMERFYSNHIVGGMDIPLALQDAQLWVRELTSRQVKDYVEKCYQSSKWEGKSKGIIEHYRERYLKMAEESQDEKPFQHPYYWAVFTVNGA